ncbi:Protein CBG22832, partial [Caenorhabditis briggsae]
LYEPLMFFYIFFLFLVFPFYVHVSRSNRERDKASSVYQVISYFYKSIILQYISLTFIVITLFPIEYFLKRHPKIVIFPGIISTIAVLIGLLSAQVNYLLISLLAIQRFSIYFHPWTEKYLQLSKWKFWFLIIIFSQTPSKDCDFSWNNIDNRCADRFIISTSQLSPHFVYLYIWQNLMLLSSCILYIPIGLSIRKFSHLASFQGNQPQRYILWQLVTIYTFSYFIIHLSSTEIEMDFYGTFFHALISMKATDALAFPLVIQISYLGCNRQNLKTFLKSLKLKKLSWKLFGNGQVEDRNQSIY